MLNFRRIAVDGAVSDLVERGDTAKAVKLLRKLAQAGGDESALFVAVADYLAADPRKPRRPSDADIRAWFGILASTYQLRRLEADRLTRDADGKLRPEFRAWRVTAVRQTAEKLGITERTVRRALSEK